MSTLVDISAHELLSVQDRVRDELRASPSFEVSAQRYVQQIHAAFSGEIALARMFMTIPFDDLPDDLRRSAWKVVEGQALAAQIKPMTPVLTLLGSHGDEAQWCDRRSSRGHAAIPLCSNSFVDSIPMVARMLQEMGVDLGLKLDTERYVKNLLGVGWVGLFYVEDARSARDDKGRRVIPSAEFVDTYNIRTVFGLGKVYANGAITAFIAFTTKVIPRAKVELLVPTVNLFKASTNELVQSRQYFSPRDGLGPA